MRILVTGGAGFIGSHLLATLLDKHPEHQILNLDKLTYAADPANIAKVSSSRRYALAKADICDRAAVREILRDFKPDGLIHLAAESHVDNSIAGPEPFAMTNVVGTFNLLEECRQYWNTLPEGLATHRFHHVSTDEVFGALGPTGLFNEETSYDPRSPYSASKASSDHWVRAYHHTYGMNVVITNCSNNFGPHQHSEKLIPTVIRTALAGKPIPVYGKGANVRDWLYVKDHCAALDLVFHQAPTGEEYCIGGNQEWSNLNLVTRICEILNETVGKSPQGDYRKQISFVTDRLGHDFRYAIDASKIQKTLGWSPSPDFDACLQTTVSWFVEKFR